MMKRLIVLGAAIGIMGLHTTGCSEGESKKDTVKTSEVPAQTAQVPAKVTEVPAVDGTQLKQTLTLKKYKMIEFGGRHCIPCKKMQPILLELTKSHGDSVAIANVYVQEQLQLGRDYKIHLIPTQVLFDKAGKELFRHTGFWDKPEILAKWKELHILDEDKAESTK